MTLLRERRDDGQDVVGPGVPLEPRIRYEDDVYSWALQQAALLQQKRFVELDLRNLADEVSDVARREYDKLESALARVLQHLLKWDYQPQRRSRSWALSIEEHRSRVADQLADHPGLNNVRARALDRAYRTARLTALRETKLPRSALPESLPYGWDELIDREIVWPEA